MNGVEVGVSAVMKLICYLFVQFHATLSYDIVNISELCRNKCLARTLPASVSIISCYLSVTDHGLRGIGQAICIHENGSKTYIDGDRLRTTIANRPLEQTTPAHDAPGETFILHYERENYYDAMHICMQFGQHAPTISQHSEQRLLENTIRTATESVEEVWIGMRRHTKSMPFIWESKAIVTYSNWDHNQPHTGDCATINQRKWRSKDCRTTLAFVCQN